MSNPFEPQPNNPFQAQATPGQPAPGQIPGQPAPGQIPGQPMQNQPMAYQQQVPGQFGRPYEHPQEQTVMILAIVGIFISIVSFVGWYIGSKAKKEMIAQGMEPTSRLKTWTTVAMVFSILQIIGWVMVLLVMLLMIPAGLMATSGAYSAMAMAVASLPLAV